MIDLAISVDETSKGLSIVETNHGDRLIAQNWPQDSDFRLVVFDSKSKACNVIAPRELAQDIGLALEMLETSLIGPQKKPEWYARLKRCAATS